jgi:hypothetical protein
VVASRTPPGKRCGGQIGAAPEVLGYHDLPIGGVVVQKAPATMLSLLACYARE